MADKRKKMPRPMAIADLLAAALQGKPAGKRLEEGKIWLVWTAAVGKQIAAKAHPVSFRDGILTVSVSSPPWMQQLTFLKKGILEKLNEQLGHDLVRDIYLKAGLPEPVAPPAKTPPKKSRALNPKEKQRISEETAPITDPDLRQDFAGLIAKHLSHSDGNRRTE
jgi:predicted nucleic acid-binding Zn ribbon protein